MAKSTRHINLKLPQFIFKLGKKFYVLPPFNFYRSCLLQCNIVCLQERSAAGKKHIQQHNKEDLAEEEEIDSNDDRRKLREDAGATFLSGTDNDLELKTKNREKGQHQVQVYYDAFVGCIIHLFSF